MVQKDLIAKIQKLLQLADTTRNSNVEEAAAAAAKAQTLMEKHRIQKAMLNEINPITWKALADNGKPDEWKLYLISVLAKHNGCYVVRSETYATDNKINIVGEDQDFETVQQLYTYLVNELNKLCIVNLLNYVNDYSCYPDNNYTKSWYIGAASTIDQKLEKAKFEARQQTLDKATYKQRNIINNALVIIDSKVDAAKTWIQKHLTVEIKNELVDKTDLKGYAAGQVAAEKINLNPNQKQLDVS